MAQTMAKVSPASKCTYGAFGQHGEADKKPRYGDGLYGPRFAILLSGFIDVADTQEDEQVEGRVDNARFEVQVRRQGTEITHCPEQAKLRAVQAFADEKEG